MSTTCLACAYCYAEPDSDFICGHPDAGVFGHTVSRATRPGTGHCGPERPKFKQHPLRNPNGSLKQVSEEP